MTQVMLERVSHRRTARRSSVMAEFVATAFHTELGWMALAQRDEVLAGIVFGYAAERQAIDALGRHLKRHDVAAVVDFIDADEQPKSVRDVIARLERYAAGEPVDFRDVAIEERHLTPFGRRIVSACRRIPVGKTRSYGELADACDSPGAARAVGQVMAKNRYPLVVPCHRVLAAGGLIGGFSAPEGLAMKRRLLELESETPFAR